MSRINKEFTGDGYTFFDVKFQQGPITTNLKDVLPGNYTFTFGMYSIQDSKTNSFTIPGEEDSHSEDDFCVSLLHESSHCVHYESVEPDLYPRTGRLFTLAEMRCNLAYDIRTSEPRKLAFARAVVREMGKLDKPTEWYEPDRDRELMEIAFRKSCRYIARLHSREELDAYSQRQFELKTRIAVGFSGHSEVSAWALTVSAFEQFRKRGIDLFSGSQGDLRSVVEDSLTGYQRYYNNVSQVPIRIAIGRSTRHPVAMALMRFESS